MSRCPRCGSVESQGCQCSAGDGDCILFEGSGSVDDPFIAVPILDADSDNLLSCSPSGLLAILPDPILVPPKCVARRNTVFPVPNGVDTILLFTTEDYDTDAMHDNSTNTSRFTANTAGSYKASLHARWEGVAAGDRRFDFRMNGADVFASDERTVSQADVFDQTCVCVEFEMDLGEYMEVVAHQNSGTDPLNLLVSGQSLVLRISYNGPMAP